MSSVLTSSNMKYKIHIDILKVPAEGAYLYDAVYVYAKALNECLLNEEDPFKGRGMMKYIVGKTYFSAMGYMVYMDENGDAEGNYTLIARKHAPGINGGYGLYPVGVFQLHENRSAVPVLKFTDRIDWVSGYPPNDEPTCGFQGEKCVMWKLAIGVTGGLILALLFGILVVYKNWAYEQELDSLIWKIDYKEIQINDFTPTATLGRIARSLQPMMRTSQVSLSSNTEADFRYTNIYTTVGIYKGRMLALKRLRKKSVDITRKMKKELKIMRDLRHDNLNPFIGACIDPPVICIVTEYCSRGSLKDILENEDVKLDNMFNASMIGDIIRGITYLHDSQIRSHGNLKSTNCLVDSRWVVKIADYGLHELKSGAEAGDDDATDFEKQCEKLLWRAPELLRDPQASQSGTQKGDTYSFGIILHEIIARNGPYGKTDKTPSEIVKNVMRRDNQPPFRPQVNKLDDSFDCVIECMQECWSEDSDERPDFKTIRTKLRPMRKGMKPNIFDNMLAMMEKYANNLEVLVDERTDQLIEEKKKTDALLYEMLPKCVADQLKRGNKVEAESFDSVTIYFSDIVGFTTMSAQSSPLQVVDFLNDLYTCFDSIIENYDVYKVETIGDAYMVVSGLPIKNGDNHAAEIASMALHLLEAVKKFIIRHRPEDTLMLRIGIHSGAVCAGVVGLKMPRYCLFGDTVNTASRMESSGLPLKIHCSEACKELLDRLGGYKFEDRGLISVKGKGDMSTFWLTGQEEHRIRKLKKNATRSSLRHSKLNRRLSLESQKRLRFAAVNPKASQENFSLVRERSESGLEIDLSNSVQPLISNSTLPKRNSCPCLGDTCERCLKSLTPKVILENSSTEKVSEVKNTSKRSLPGWRKMSRFSSFVSCLGSGEVNDTSDFDELGFLRLDSKHLSVIGHSESEPFLPHLRYCNNHSEKKNEIV
ncbi:guanylate cyclase 32E isoform X3 [Parasteatoda tepidariorum]|uniref:guanylate cyclase 32E isoform X3 n=1 Tax=Parasteatoda tepidariorum TaxID=114398 RepID=UPI0039BCD4C8